MTVQLAVVCGVQGQAFLAVSECFSALPTYASFVCHISALLVFEDVWGCACISRNSRVLFIHQENDTSTARCSHQSGCL